MSQTMGKHGRPTQPGKTSRRSWMSAVAGVLLLLAALLEPLWLGQYQFIYLLKDITSWNLAELAGILGYGTPEEFARWLMFYGASVLVTLVLAVYSALLSPSKRRK